MPVPVREATSPSTAETPHAAASVLPSPKPLPVACCSCAGSSTSGKNGRRASDNPPDDSSRRQNPETEVNWVRLGLSIVLAGQGMLLGLGLNTAEEVPVRGSLEHLLIHTFLAGSACAVLYLLGRPLLMNSLRAVRERRVQVEGLFVLGLIGGLVGSLVNSFTGEGSVYYEVVSVVLVIYTVGQLLKARSREPVLKEAAKLRESYDWAWLEGANGSRHRVPVAELQAGQGVVVIMPGEPVTVDGSVLSGQADVRETALSGEPLPVLRREGDYVRAGSFVLDGILRVKPERVGGQREIDRLLATVEAGYEETPSDFQLLADRLASWFVPFVAGVSLLTFVGWWLRDPAGGWAGALFNAMAVLLVACPCALGLATPLAVWNGLMKMTRLGLIAREGRLIDALAHASHLFFDKTGTLSEPDVKVTEVRWAPAETEGHLARQGAAAVLAVLEQDQVHPVARALHRWATDFVSPEISSRALPRLENLRLHPGQGLSAIVDGRLWTIGSALLLPECSREQARALCPQAFSGGDTAQKWVFLSTENKLRLALRLAELLREDLQLTVKALRDQGLEMSILTGDPFPAWEQIEGIPLRAGLSPEDKARLVQEETRKGTRLIFIGDGLNDAAAMSLAPASIAMGSGARLTQQTATGVLPGDRLEVLPQAIAIARAVRRNVYQNFAFALCYNTTGIALAAAGLLHPVAAALIMVGSSLTVSARALGHLR